MYSHRRYNPLTAEWIIVSPHRTKRPWLGQVEKTPPENLPAYDPQCYLCPGNERVGGVRNPAYTDTFVFDNDFAAIMSGEEVTGLISNSPISSPSSDLFQLQPESGTCRVICFSPRHDVTLPVMDIADIEKVIAVWREQTRELGARPDIQYVQVFENKGAMMGASNPHPHSQVWATTHIPNEPSKELRTQSAYYAEHGRTLLSAYLEAERQSGERVIVSNDHFTALVPFWAIWPFETMLIAHRAVPSLLELTEAENTALADILKRLTTRYDNLFEISFPYSMGFHQAPTDKQPHPEWHLHAHFYPPLLRSATVRKFMVGYELLSMPQRDLTPEQAADRLKGLSETHYTVRRA